MHADARRCTPMHADARRCTPMHADKTLYSKIETRLDQTGTIYSLDLVLILHYPRLSAAEPGV